MRQSSDGTVKATADTGDGDLAGLGADPGSLGPTSRIAADPEEKANRWKEEWERHYPDRKTNFILVQVVSDRLEMISYNRGILYDPETGSAQAVEFPGGAGSG